MSARTEIGRRNLLKGGGAVALDFLFAKNGLPLLGIGIGLAAIAEYKVNIERTLKNMHSVLQPDPPYDAIVVLGAGNSLEKGKEVPSMDGQLRVIAGIEEYRKGSTKLIRYAGGGSGTPEAKVYAGFGMEYDLTPLSILSLDTASTDTVSNLREIIRWKKENPHIRKIGVSTNGYHMLGVQVLGENLGLHLYPVVAEQVLVDTGKPELIQRVRDFYAAIYSDSSRIDKEQERLAMLIIDADSNISHERKDWEKRMPFLEPGLAVIENLLKVAGQKFVPLEVRPVI